MQSTLSMNVTTDPSATQETACTFKAFAREKQLCCTHAPKSTFMVDSKQTNQTMTGTRFLIDCEKLKVVIKKAMLEDNNTEVIHDEFSAKSFLQSEEGITGLLSIKIRVGRIIERENPQA